jgi:protein-disulfide isomerase
LLNFFLRRVVLIKYIIALVLFVLVAFGAGVYVLGSGYEFDLDFGKSVEKVEKNKNPNQEKHAKKDGSKETQDLKELTRERYIGKDNAPLIMYDMSSYTCGHCGRFHLDTLKKIEKKYVDTGKLKIIFADFPLGMRAAAAAMLTRCVPEKNYMKMTNILFENQRSWAYATDAKKILINYALMAGLSREKADSCLQNQKLLDAIISKREELQKKYSVDGTPTFVITNKLQQKTIKGAVGFSVFDETIKAMLKN